MVMKVQLKGKTHKGKNRIAEQGDIWEIVREQDCVILSSEFGPWLLLSSGDNLRWVHKTKDENFQILENG